MIVDFSRCKITHPNGVINRGRFIFRNGNAAVWVENKRERTAERVLYATDGEFSKAATGRVPHRLLLPGDTTWEIVQQTGGCGCGGSPTSGYSIDDLLSPDLSSI